MRAFLPYVGLVDVVPGSGSRADYRIRLAGSHVECVFGQITGRSLQRFLPPDIDARWRHAFDLTIEAAAPLRFTGRVSFEHRTWLESETLLAPLVSAQGRMDMLFAGFAAWTNDEAPALDP